MSGLLPACSRLDSDDEKSGKQRPAVQPGMVSLDSSTQARIGIEIRPLESAEIQPRFAVTGRVVDPSLLASQLTDIVVADAAAQASQAERKRIEGLAAQNNASERALQAAQAAAVRDQAQADAAHLKLSSTWGSAIASRPDLATWVQALSANQITLVRVDLPVGETLRSDSPRARLSTLAGESVNAEFLTPVPAVDPQTQGRSWYYLARADPSLLLSGMALEGYLEETGPTLHGILVPRAAVVRYEGEGWVYQESSGTNFMRTLIPLDRPVDQGWFVPGGILPGTRIVVTGAQSVLSRELNGTGFQSGDRD